MQRIGDLIHVLPVQTVIRLEEGRTAPESITASFVFTADVSSHITLLADSLARPTGCGFFLQGDFGSGKSHFLAALSAWLCAAPGALRMTGLHDGLRRMQEAKRRLLPVSISLINYRASTALEPILAQAVQQALLDRGAAAELSPAADEERHQLFGRMIDTVLAAGFDGLVLFIDELSEFFRSKPDPASLNEDARTLQLLGELGRGRPLWIIAAVQESIEQTGDIAQATFRKIKDRFPVKLALTTLHIRDLIAKRLIRHKEGADEQIHRAFEDYRANYPGFTADYALFNAVYPVHPVTLSLLQGLGDLFSQHRGIVDFVHARVGGDPSRGIPGILDQPFTELLAPDAIYEHFSQRIQEFSAFHAYPRHVVPHLDEVIHSVIEGDDDRALARRLVRILTLYNLHPAAEVPTARALAQLSGCMIAPHDPDANVQFVTGAILDPVVANSRFLVKKSAASGDPLDAVYTVTTREDHSKTFKARLSRIGADIPGNDSRLVLQPLAELPPSMSWPGAEIMRDIMHRPVTWRHSQRTAGVLFVPQGGEQQAAGRIASAIAAGSIDFALAIAFDKQPFAAPHTAVWRVPSGGPGVDTLREYLSVKLLLSELKPGNPADAPILPMVKEQAARLSPLAAGALMSQVYAGAFDHAGIRVDAAALQIRRFDRLLETAAETMLEERYPRFKEIAPRTMPPSPRMYQRLLEEFVAPGTLSLSEARAKGLAEAIEALAVPLGLIELKSGSYRLAPNPSAHPFLSQAFGLLSPSQPTQLSDFVMRLRTGEYGVPADMAMFVLVSLAHCGMVTLLKSGRAVPLDFISITSVENADAVAPGEIISQADREYLVSQCGFLAPAGGFSSFGLRQQRDAWQAAVKLKKSLDPLIEEIARRSAAASEYAAFRSFDLAGLEKRLNALRTVFDEVKISYQAREGLERFLSAWRASGLTLDDIESVRKLHRFFASSLDQFVFVAHYVKHRSVENAVAEDDYTARSREAVNVMLASPETMVVRDEGVQLSQAFELFRDAYARVYGRGHESYSRSLERPDLSRYSQRLVPLLRRLAAIDTLDRPAGLHKLLADLDAPHKPPCRRSIREELLRSAICACGYQYGDAPPQGPDKQPDETIARCFADYGVILASSAVREAITARAFALKDLSPDMARRLERLSAALAAAAGAPADLLDEQTIIEIGNALSGRAAVRDKPLAALIETLSGRRLTPDKVRRAVDEWLDTKEPDAIIAIGEVNAAGAAAPASARWWSLLRPDLFSAKQTIMTIDEARALEKSCEELFPARGVGERLARIDDARLSRFIAEEPCHTRAIQTAWNMLALRVLGRSVDSAAIAASSRHLVPAEAAAVAARLELLRRLNDALFTAFPDRLSARLHIAALALDPWAASDLHAAADAALDALAAASADWFDSLPPVLPIDIRDNPLVLIVDGLAPDVWLAASTTMGIITKTAVQTWWRLEAKPETVPAMNALFGFANDRDPVNEFSARSIAYHLLSGDEAHSALNLLPPLPADRPAVVRFGAIDKAAHTAGARLVDLPELVRAVVARHVPDLLEYCTKAKRRLVFTTDHGMSFTKRKLSHGRGGVFECAVMRLEWLA